MSGPTERRVFGEVEAATEEIGRWLWAIGDARARTLRRLEGLTPAGLAWMPPGGGNPIGALLYHVALIEADYLYEDVLGAAEWPGEIVALFPYPDRDAVGRLTVPPAMALDEHLRRLTTVRARLVATFAAMGLVDFRRPRALATYTITPEWTLHHLMQHEAEHRGEIETLRSVAAGLGGVA